MTNLVDRKKIIHTDALQYYDKYCDVYYMEDVPEVERIATAWYVADQILPGLLNIYESVGVGEYDGFIG